MKKKAAKTSTKKSATKQPAKALPKKKTAKKTKLAKPPLPHDDKTWIEFLQFSVSNTNKGVRVTGELVSKRGNSNPNVPADGSHLENFICDASYTNKGVVYEGTLFYDTPNSAKSKATGNLTPRADVKKPTGAFEGELVVTILVKKRIPLS